jgi:hypothetical protein
VVFSRSTLFAILLMVEFQDEIWFEKRFHFSLEIRITVQGVSAIIVPEQTVNSLKLGRLVTK